MSDIEDSVDLFQEPEDFRPKLPDPTFETYTRPSQYVKDGEPSEIVVRLVGKSPLWGHMLWNAGIVTTDYIEKTREKYITGKNVLELGAAAALPSLSAALSAKNVVITDYPDPDLIENIDYNVDLLKQTFTKKLDNTATVGYIWGNAVDELLNAPGQNGDKYDFIILSDLIFNHSEHFKLLKSCHECLADNGTIFVVFSHHRPRLADRDLQFFEDAKDWGFKSECIIEKKMSPMFEKDEGSPEVRAMVYGYLVTRA